MPRADGRSISEVRDVAKKVSPQEAYALMQAGEYRYLDVRSEPEFEQGHPPGALNVPLMHKGMMGMSPNDKFLSVVEANFPRDAKLIVGCQAGGRSAKAVAALEQAGYTNLIDQGAGWGGNPEQKGWQAVGLPSESGQPEGRSYAALGGTGK
jgi:rhodanese-related sulfurtransferase